MLPAPGVFYFPWEISSGAVQEGTTVRTFGRLKCYQPAESQAILSSHFAATQHQVIVHTVFVEPFHPILGAQYIVLGELEITEGAGLRVHARVLNCVDGVDLTILQSAINEQRSYFQDREGGTDIQHPPP
ncbi:hypothetical protein COCON_G00026870 [Conger conger]|uniref:CST complex subunit TEN1 n=1 Tax=Conger conger TaxID=82655 RepID=A0A9Q1DXX2_CONCO|nr:CST complex subunit TEN1 [Conger conger]KAJ8283837.1 hypothetical protein COCON_G00026870 [Conger conger]